jgi:hypothetical protein
MEEEERDGASNVAKDRPTKELPPVTLYTAKDDITW